MLCIAGAGVKVIRFESALMWRPKLKQADFFSSFFSYLWCFVLLTLSPKQRGDSICSWYHSVYFQDQVLHWVCQASFLLIVQDYSGSIQCLSCCFCRIISLSPGIFVCPQFCLAEFTNSACFPVSTVPQISVYPLVFACIYANFCEKMLDTGYFWIVLQFYRILVHHLSLHCCRGLVTEFKASKCSLYLLLLYGWNQPLL